MIYKKKIIIQNKNKLSKDIFNNYNILKKETIFFF